MVIVEFRGEKITQSELIRRFLALYPAEGGVSIQRRIKAEVGHVVSPQSVNSIRHGDKMPSAMTCGPSTTSSAFKRQGPEVAKVIDCIRKLRDCIKQLGSKEAVESLLKEL